MCSSCSGDYERDEGPDCALPEPPERTASGGTDGEGRSSWTARRGKSTTRERRESEAARNGQGLEEFEVLVSAARIVEVRTIPAIPLSSLDLSSSEPGGRRAGSRREYKRSGNESAKYYQTGEKVGKPTKHSPHVGRRGLLHWGLALLALTAATLWLALR
jgi:hypothetical protein